MILSRSGKPDPDLEGVELIIHQKGGSASFGGKIVLSLNGVDLGCMNPITGSTCRTKCSNILHDMLLLTRRHWPQCNIFKLESLSLAVTSTRSLFKWKQV
jgi:hypothetical protein